MIQANYAEIQRVLAGERSLTDAAEAHGTLAGCLCAAANYRFEDWLLDILPSGEAQPAAAMALQALFASTAGSLAGLDMAFEPLLPKDSEPIVERTDALATWCQGFLYGLGSGSGATQDVAGLPGEVGQVVNDLIAISGAAVDPLQSDESNESAYAELVEFVRVGVQIVFEELAPLRQPSPSPKGASFH